MNTRAEYMKRRCFIVINTNDRRCDAFNLVDIFYDRQNFIVNINKIDISSIGMEELFDSIIKEFEPTASMEALFEEGQKSKHSIFFKTYESKGRDIKYYEV